MSYLEKLADQFIWALRKVANNSDDFFRVLYRVKKNGRISSRIFPSKGLAEDFSLGVFDSFIQPASEPIPLDRRNVLNDKIRGKTLLHRTPEWLDPKN